MSFERKNIEKMQGYAPGEQTGAANTIKLNTNENPYPPSPKVAEALRSINVAALRRYPSPMADAFRGAASRLHNISAEQIIPTNGGDELLRLVLTTYVEQLDTIAVCKPSYSLYPVLAEIQGCRLEEIPLNDDWSMPEDFLEQLNRSAAKLLILVNPNAPTGALLPADYLAKVAENFSGLLLIDEAYVDFIDPELNYDSISLVNSHDNILILRTLSKAYSLAGLRFGYGIAAKSLIEPMMFKTRDSYNTDHIAQSLATAALDSFEYARENSERIRQSRKQLRADLQELGLTAPESQTNFILCQVPESIGAENLYQQLKQRNILVRYFDQDRLRDKLRISIGSEAENTALVTALKELLQQKPANSSSGERLHYCPRCKKPLRRIQGKMGPFWGCTGFPDCRTSFNDVDGKPSEDVDEHYRCPLCTRQLVKADKEKGDYWFCSGYSKGCKVTLPDHDGVPEAAYQCQKCSHLLVKRSGKNGVFWGCSDYPGCTASYDDDNNRPKF